jgi:hypothetical protein
VNIKNVQLLRRLLIVVPLTLAGVMLIGLQFGGSVTNASKLQLDSLSTSTKLQGAPVPTSTPQVMVNGRPVHVDSGGNADVTIPESDGSVTHIVASGGQTTVTSTSSSTTANTEENPAKPTSSNITVNSNPTYGNSWSANQAYGFSHSSTANGSSSSFSTTQVFSTGSSNVDITSP